MAGQRCKEILDHGYIAFTESVRIAVKELKADGSLKPQIADELADRMACIDLCAMYGGQVPDGGYGGVALELQGLGHYTDDIWKLYVKPVGYKTVYS